MQYYPYAVYPNGAPMPGSYVIPANYRDPYARILPVVHPTPYVPQPVSYPAGVVPLGYRPGYVAPVLPPPSMPMVIPATTSHRSRQLQPSQAYYSNRNGSRRRHPVMPMASKASKKGTKVKASEIYRNKKTKPDIQNNDENQQMPFEPALPWGVMQPSPPRKVYRSPSATSSCSHCSTYSNSSCSECCHQKRGDVYDDCPQCRADLERERFSRHKHK